MQEMLQPLIHKAAVHAISINVARSGLAIGDAAALLAMPDGQVGVYIIRTKRILGLIPRRVAVMIGNLGPQATALISPAVQRNEQLRVRIVGLTPEHLAVPPAGPEVHISVWGDPRHLTEWASEVTPAARVANPPPTDPA